MEPASALSPAICRGTQALSRLLEARSTEKRKDEGYLDKQKGGRDAQPNLICIYLLKSVRLASLLKRSHSWTISQLTSTMACEH